MSAAFSSASIDNTAPPITTYPFTVGVWAFTNGVTSGQTFFGLANNSGSNNYFYLGTAAGNNYQMFAQSGGTSGSTNVTTLAATVWSFCLARFISATSRRLSVLDATGRVSHGQNTTSVTPSGPNAVSLGRTPLSTPSFALGGRLAEFWWTDTDVQADGAQTQDALVRQLAFGGPFSVSHVAARLIEYHAMLSHPVSDRVGEVYHGKFGRQAWVNNGAILAPHCPLPYWYAKPGQTRRVLTV